MILMVTISVTDSVGCRSTDEAMILMVTVSVTDSAGFRSTDDRGYDSDGDNQYNRFSRVYVV